MIKRLPTVFAVLCFAFSVWAAPVRDQHVVADLIPETTSIQSGQPFWVGLRLSMDEHWHTYWKNCGDACQPTSLKWTLPPGFTNGPIHWPAPIRFSASPEVVNYGYEGDALLLVQLFPPSGLEPGTSVEIKARAKWLMCSDSCIPGKADFTLNLPVTAAAAELDATKGELFADARKRLPVPATNLELRTSIASGNLVISVPSNTAQDGFFFIEDDGIVRYEGQQVWQEAGTRRELHIPMARDAAAPERIRGVLVPKDKAQPALQLDLPFRDAAKPAGTASTASAIAAPSTGETGLTFWSGLLAMFVGGLILNLMPCVFPVLSLKIVGFVESSKEGHGSATAHAGAFVGGVMVSMWALAGVLLVLRSQGGAQGWAFQMANPHFVLGLIFLFLLIGLNMFGVFEMGVGVTGAGGGLQAKKGLAGSFFSGLLTTVAGAPCAGPFLGSAIGFALSQSSTVALLSFTAMGLGTAAPYALFSTIPSLLKFIPRPGAWMDTMKQLMGFPMVATAAWFAASFVKLQGGENAELRVEAMKSLLFGTVAVAIAAWVYGKWAALHREPRTRWIARLASVALLVGASIYASQKPETVFEPWSPEKIAKLREAGKPIFVDFTAEWCAICQVNKQIIERDDVLAAFKAKGVTLMLADWTDNNERVGAGLAEFGRAAVPLYLLYGRDATLPPQILPQALTPGQLKAAIDAL